MNLVLSLFPGIGLLDIAFEEQDFCIVRGPDLLWGGDIKKFHPPSRRFDGVIGGPPCQAFSRLRHMVEHNGHKKAENLIPEFERVISEALPAWFLMENVEDAPEPSVSDYRVKSFVLNNRWLGEEQKRERRFSFALKGQEPIDLRRFIQLAALESVAYSPAVCASDGGRYQSVRIGGNGKPKRAVGVATAPRRTIAESLRLQGLAGNFLDHTPFTAEGKRKVIGNGVPLPMGRAIARAVRCAIEVSP